MQLSSNSLDTCHAALVQSRYPKEYVWPSIIYSDDRIDSEIHEPRWKTLEPDEIAIKCSILDSSNKIYAPKDPKKDPPTGPLPSVPKPAKPLTNSIISNSLAEANSHRTVVPAPTEQPSGQPSSWMPRSQANILASSFDDDTPSCSPQAASRFRRNGANVTTGKETIGFFPDDVTTKPREAAEDIPFTVRTSQAPSVTSSSVDESKHSQEVNETAETISGLLMYRPVRN